MSEVEFLEGQTVEEVRFGAGIRIVFDNGDSVEPEMYVYLGSYVISDPSGETFHQDEDRPRLLGPTLELVGKSVRSTSTDGATLTLRFADGTELRCDPSPEYEAWQAVGGTPKRLVVCLTEGELSVWTL